MGRPVWGDQYGFDPALLDVLVAADQLFVLRIRNQHGFAAVGDVARNTLACFLGHSLLGSGIPAGLMHQQKAAIALHHPHVNRLAFERLAEFRADEREKLIHLERGAEDFFNIVELRDAADRGQRVVPLVFVLLGGSQGGSGNLGQTLQSSELRFSQWLFEAENLDRANQGIVDDQRKIGKRMQSFADVEMSVLFADQRLAEEQERFGVGGKDSKRARLDGDGFIGRGFADGSAHGPAFSLGSRGDEVDVDGGSGQQGGEGLPDDSRPGCNLPGR